MWWIYKKRVGPTKYIKKAHHYKKILSNTEINNRLWKKKTHMKNNQPSFKRKYKKFMTRIGHKKHRQFARNSIHWESFEMLSTDPKHYKQFINPWDWD